MNNADLNQLRFNHNNAIRDVRPLLKDKTTQTNVTEPERVLYFTTEISNINSIPCSKQVQITPNDNNSYCETTETHMLAIMLTIQNNNIKQQKDPSLDMQSIVTKSFDILHKQQQPKKHQHHKSRNAFNKEQNAHSKKELTFGEISIIPHRNSSQNNHIVVTLWPAPCQEQPTTNHHNIYNMQHNYYTINSFKTREAHFKKGFNTRQCHKCKQSKRNFRRINVSHLNKEFCYKCKQTQFQHKALEHIITHKQNK